MKNKNYGNPYKKENKIIQWLKKDILQKVTIMLLLIIVIQLSVAGIIIMNLAQGLELPDFTILSDTLNSLTSQFPDFPRYNQLIMKLESLPFDKLNELGRVTEFMQRWDDEDRTDDLLYLMDLMIDYYEGEKT